MHSLTINQINGFLQSNPVLHHFVGWRERENYLDKAWREELIGEPQRGLQRKTFRGNCIYGNLQKSIAAKIGINVREYNYHRDNMKFYLDVDWYVKLDIDGVWINASLPWMENPESWGTTTFFQTRLRANVPFERDALLAVVQRYNDKFFFPDGTVLGAIQRKYRKSKKQAMAFLKDVLRQNERPSPLSIEDYEIQRALCRRLKRKNNINCTVGLTEKTFTALAKLERFKKTKTAQHFDMSWVHDLDGDVDEIEAEFYNQVEDDVLYI